MATALIEVVLAGTDEKVEFMLRSGETAELAIVNKDPHHVVCKVFVESVDGLLSSIMAIEVGGQRALPRQVIGGWKEHYDRDKAWRSGDFENEVYRTTERS
jgi:hypothetical protein